MHRNKISRSDAHNRGAKNLQNDSPRAGERSLQKRFGFGWVK